MKYMNVCRMSYFGIDMVDKCRTTHCEGEATGNKKNYGMYYPDKGAELKGESRAQVQLILLGIAPQNGDFTNAQYNDCILWKFNLKYLNGQVGGVGKYGCFV